MKSQQPAVTKNASGGAWARITSVVAIGSVVLLVLLLLTWAVQLLLLEVTHGTLAWLAAVLMVLALPVLVLVALGAWYFGRVEVRGFLSGVDRTVDALGSAVVHGAKGVASGRAVSTIAPLSALPTVRVLPAAGDGEDLLLD